MSTISKAQAAKRAAARAEDRKIGPRLYHLRTMAGMSQGELGRRVGAVGSQISRYEKTMVPQMWMLRLLADALGTTLSYLVGDG